MIIARSSCSELSGGGGNSCRRSLRERPCKPQRKQIRFGLVTLMTVAILPERAKPATFFQAMSTCGKGAVRGDWEQRVGIDRLRNLGDPPWWPHGQRPRQMHKTGSGLARKSDASIVVMKRLTAAERRGAAKDQQPTTKKVSS
jgi:hypothetical protein